MNFNFRIYFNYYFFIFWMCWKSNGQNPKDFWNRLKEVNALEPDVKNTINFHDGSRPHPSDELPIIDLQEHPNPLFDPKDSDIDYRRLRRMLGREYNRNFMSAVRPLEHVLHKNGTLDFKLRKNRPKGRRPLYIKNFGKPIYAGENRKPIKLHISRQNRKKVQKYLWNYAHCPVFHTWKDLGVRFWPRWIREGQCYKGRSCSIPPGMYCKQSDKTEITLLRWYCKGPKVGTNCSWIKVQYPILTKCKCSCS